MKNGTISLVRAQAGQLRFGVLKHMILFFMAALNIILAMTFGNEFESVAMRNEVSGSQFVLENLNTIIPFMMMFIGASVGDICGADFVDKSFYYETMGGRTRKQSYIARVAVAMLYTVIGCMVIIAAGPVAATLRLGWGTVLTKEEFLIRIAALIAPLIRITALYIVLTFVLKSKNITLLAGFAGMVVYVQLMKYFPYQNDILGVTTIRKLTHISTWAVYGLDDEIYTLVDAAPDIPGFTASIIISLGAAALILWLGYRFFHDDDLN